MESKSNTTAIILCLLLVAIKIFVQKANGIRCCQPSVCVRENQGKENTERLIKKKKSIIEIKCSICVVTQRKLGHTLLDANNWGWVREWILCLSASIFSSLQLHIVFSVTAFCTHRCFFYSAYLLIGSVTTNSWNKNMAKNVPFSEQWIFNLEKSKFDPGHLFLRTKFVPDFQWRLKEKVKFQKLISLNNFPKILLKAVRNGFCTCKHWNIIRYFP